ncbi:hypothetical protein, partial [Agrobacterium rosae]|uniref:hypothetical protein n=1 Tax=Agrobacterium rosae TaxID=1972867 RepID=UPI003B9DFD85
CGLQVMSLTSYRAAPPRVTSVNPEGIYRARANSQSLRLYPTFAGGKMSSIPGFCLSKIPTA